MANVGSEVVGATVPGVVGAVFYDENVRTPSGFDFAFHYTDVGYSMIVEG